MNKDKLINSAVKVFNEDFHAPLERVAEVAQISKRTLYRYFKDREALITACYADMLENWYQAMVTAFTAIMIRSNNWRQCYMLLLTAV